jgi:predicted nucleic acid-binding protein
VLDGDDAHHDTARAVLETLESHGLVTHSYVLAESVALVQHRLGHAATRDLIELLFPLLSIVWVDADLHGVATSTLLAAARRGVSLVDWTSFELMRRRAIRDAFAFDEDFVRQGFRLLS